MDSLQISVKNFRAIASAEVEVNPVALVCARNEGGKTSLAQAVAAAMTQRANILDGLNKQDSRELLHDGSARGTCHVILTDEGSADGPMWAAHWPGCTVKTNTKPISAHAAGTASLVDLPAKAVGAELVRILGGEPTEAETLAALAAAGVSEAMAAAIWKAIAKDGWEASHAKALTRCTEHKGAWRQVTGETWGAAKAPSWEAPGTVDGDIETLEALAEKAQAALGEAAANRAVAADQIEAWKKQVQAGELAATDRPAIEKMLEESRANVARLSSAASSLPRPAAENQACPACKAPLEVRAGMIHSAEPISPAENKKRSKAITDAETALENTRGQVASRARELAALDRTIMDGRDAEQNIANAKTDGTSAEEMEAAGAAHNVAKRALSAASDNKKALDNHAKIIGFQAAAEVLAPAGIRQTVSRRYLGELVATMGGLAAVGGWKPVTIADTGVIVYGSKAYLHHSVAAKLCARILLQLAISMRQGEPLVIIDAADVLDSGKRNGLFKILREVVKTGMRALVTMTMNKPEDMPNVGKIGLGRCYWIEGGQTE